MRCDEILDKVYGYSGEEEISFILQLRIRFHLFFCPQCSQEIERFELARESLKNDFFYPAPGLEEAVMARIAAELAAGEAGEEDPVRDNPGGISTRAWSLTGILIFISLASSFLGLNFAEVAAAGGISFLLPIGITIGVVITCYGALFIGSHLKEFSERFGLH
ncbi:MAG: peptidoglycan-binding protein [Treponema sp.]|jgi:hypothetical protein|nr:peptidoglycan-binding protein [Treponema sp.]